jgi:hypothetical protein
MIAADRTAGLRAQMDVCARFIKTVSQSVGKAGLAPDEAGLLSLSNYFHPARSKVRTASA